MKIGVLILKKKTERATRKDSSFDSLAYFGLRYILSELKNKYEFTSPGNVYKYDYVLVSLISVFDIENFLYSVNYLNKGKAKIIVGGAGCVNIRAISDYIDIAVFGRVEEQINEILAGKNFENVWRKDKDPFFKKEYIYRQPQFLLPRERNVGCRFKCYFCHYSWTHKRLITNQKEYYTTDFVMGSDEDTFKELKITDGRHYITGLDGLTQKTRFRVNKRITDKDIEDKFEEIYKSKVKTRISLKIYEIIGYPWDTDDSVKSEMEQFLKLISKIDLKKKIKNIYVFLQFTPFSPDPLTPMQYHNANIKNWRGFLEVNYPGLIYDGRNIKIITLDTCPSLATHLRRLLIQRCNNESKGFLQKLFMSDKFYDLSTAQKVKILTQAPNYEIATQFITPKEARETFGYLKTPLMDGWTYERCKKI